jgi:hypothetical protein
MRTFFEEQGRTRVFAEVYMEYIAGRNPRRTPLIGKRTISGWKLVSDIYLLSLYLDESLKILYKLS